MAEFSSPGTVAAAPHGRRRLLLRTAGACVAAVALRPGPGLAQVAGTGGLVRWTSPRGTVEVLDDYPYWVARRLGYFGDLETTLDPGPMRAEATVEAVEFGDADVGYPSALLLARGLDRGSPLVSVWQMGAYDVFGLAFRPGGRPASPAGLAGKRILLGSLAWRAAADPLLAQHGIDPAGIAYVEAGTRWGEALARGEGDAALCWEGLRAQWAGQGLAFDYLTPDEFSRLPAGCFAVRRTDLADPWRVAALERYLRGWAMGLEFGHHNPRAAAQIVTEVFPALAAALRPEVAVAAVGQLGRVYRGPWERRQGWGWHDIGQWQTYLDLARRLGYVTRPLRAEDGCVNDLVPAANAFDAAAVAADAGAFRTGE